MAMGLSATNYEVVDLRPPAFGAWIDTADNADALILDLENPKLAVAAVTNLRAHGKLAPVLLVSSDRPGWDDPEMRQLPAAAVLPLPISRPALLSALEDLLTDPWAAEVTPPQHAEVTQALQELVIGPDDLMTPDDDLDALISAPPAREPIPDYDPPARYQPLDDMPEWSSRGAVVAGVVAAETVDAEPDAEADPEVADLAEPIDEVVPEPLDDSPQVGGDPEAPVIAASAEDAPTEDEAVQAAAADQPSPPVEADPKTGEVEAIPQPAEEPVTEAVAVATADGDEPDHPPLSAVPRTRRTAHLPSSATTATSTSLREMEALRPGATPARRRDTVHTQRRPSPVAVVPPLAASAAVQRTQEPPVGVTAGHAARGEDAIDLVRRLSGQLHRLYGVPEVSEVIVTDAVDRTKADAGAILVPDVGDWRVAAGVGLRPLETRYELHEDSWVVQQVAKAHKGVIVEESDVAREQLQGAPLASWRHLLAAPVRDVEAVILLARRDDPPFDEEDLAVLATLGNEAGPLLSAALDTRSLARHLYDFRDETDLPH
jgi:hypothetical protein